MPRMYHLPTGMKLAPGTPVRIIHKKCKGKRIYETSFVGEDGISTRSSLSAKVLSSMQISSWSVNGPGGYYTGSVSTKSLCEGNRLIAMCKKSEIPKGIRHRYACSISYDRNKYPKSLAETNFLLPPPRAPQSTICLPKRIQPKAILPKPIQELPAPTPQGSSPQLPAQATPGPQNIINIPSFILTTTSSIFIPQSSTPVGVTTYYYCQPVITAQPEAGPSSSNLLPSPETGPSSTVTTPNKPT